MICKAIKKVTKTEGRGENAHLVLVPGISHTIEHEIFPEVHRQQTSEF